MNPERQLGRQPSHRAADASPAAPTALSLNRVLSGSSLRTLLLAILLLGAFLRFYRLDAQSFWNDEGNSARLAERSLALIVEGAAGDIHPPGYYLLLHFWRALFGQSELALRSLSAVAGLTLVLFTYALGSQLFNRYTGLMAAFASVISPFAIYYAQEARMYALLAAFSGAATLAASGLARVLLRPRSPAAESAPSTGDTRRALSIAWTVGYALLAAAGLYTHYAFAFVLISHNAIFALWWGTWAVRIRPRWSPLLVWGGAQALAILLYLPWLPCALGAPGWSSPGVATSLGPALLDVLRVLTVGITLPLSQSTIAVAFASTLLLIAIVPIQRPVGMASGRAELSDADTQGGSGMQASGLVEAGVLLHLLLLIALFFLFRLYKPAWIKFLVIALPPFHVLLGHGVYRVGGGMRALVAAIPPLSRRRSRYIGLATCLILLLLLGGLTCPSLRNLYFDPAYARDDYRQLTADILAERKPGDAIILNAPNQWEVFTYYYPDHDVYPVPYRPTAAKAATFLEPILEQHKRLFVLYWGDVESDPKKRIESWLAEHAYKASDRWYGDVRLATYGVAPLPGQGDVPLDALFGDAMRLRGIALQEHDLAPGDILPVTLFWRAEGAIDQSYKVTLQLLDEEGKLAAQIDTEPRDGLAPTTCWQPGEELVDRYGVLLPPDRQPGRYRLIVAVYHGASGERLPALLGGESAGDHVPLIDLTVRSSR